MIFNYTVYIHSGDGCVQNEFESTTPVNIGHVIAFGLGEDEYTITDIVHTHCDETAIHCKMVE